MATCRMCGVEDNTGPHEVSACRSEVLHKAEAERLRAAAIAAAEILRRVQTGHAYGVPCGIWTLSDRKAIADAHDLLSAVLTPPDPAWKEK